MTAHRITGTTSSDLLLSDPHTNKSWYYEGSRLSELRIDVASVWEDYSGAGVKVAVIDTQIDYRHPDLAASYDQALDYNFDQDSDVVVIDDSDLPAAHGTTVAGIITAEGGNGIGSVGIAHGATLVGLGIDYGATNALDQVVGALRASNSEDVVNNSWSFVDNFDDNFNRNEDMREAMEFIATTGRDGLGTNAVFSAGNAGGYGSSNYHNFQNSPYSIAVGAIDQDGSASSFSSIGANVLVSAAGQNVFTTTLRDRYDDPAGTSFSAPAVSGVIALMLEANPNLGYRDVQQILALSAQRDGLSDDPRHGNGWITNGADNHNGGGMHFSDSFGYGFVNAHDAVRLAETWTEQQTAANRTSLAFSGEVGETMVAGSNDHISFAFEVDDAVTIEHVEFSMDFRWLNTADLDVILTSPDGTSVNLVYDLPIEERAGSLRDFSFSSVATMGEISQGVWTVDVYNRDPDAVYRDEGPMTALLDDFQFTVHGDATDLADDTYFYTDEFARIYDAVELVRRTTLEDADGGIDAINVAAITSSTRIDLSGATTSIVAGVNVDIAGNEIENVFAGDGNDELIGNTADNWIVGGRGDDVFHYSYGNDVLEGGDGFDTLSFDMSSNGFQAFLTEAGEVLLGFVDAGFSFVTGIESYSFSDVVYGFADILGLIDGVGSLPPVEEPQEPETPESPEDSEPLPVVQEPETELEFDVVIEGTSGVDRLRGSDSEEAIFGYSDDDRLFGNDGDDALYGGDGSDALFAGVGNDHLEGGAGADRLIAGEGDDILLGGEGRDGLRGNAGDDYLNGGSGRDRLWGGEGADTFVIDVNFADDYDNIRDFNEGEGDQIMLIGFEHSMNDLDFTFIDAGGATFLEMSTGGESIRLARLFGEGHGDLMITPLGDELAFLI